MKKITPAITFLMLALIACNMSSGNPTSTPELFPMVPSQIPAITSTPVLTTPDGQTPAFTPIATVQPELQNTIRFSAGGTSTDVPDSLSAGESKTYTLNAMQGQFMSVSVLGGGGGGAWGYFPIEIKGSDGTIFCPLDVDTECGFWRGKLPVTQDYFITVKAAGDLTDYTLRVAINPPGKEAQFFQYKNPASGLTLTYSDQFAPSLFPSYANSKTNTELVLQFIDSNFYVKTNLSEVYFLLGSSTDPQMVASCTAPNESAGAPEEMKGSEMFNGYNFVHSQAMGAGAGNIYEQEIYRLADKGVCYEAIFFIHYSNIGNYPAGAVTEFNQNTLLQKLAEILSTFQVK